MAIYDPKQENTATSDAVDIGAENGIVGFASGATMRMTFSHFDSNYLPVYLKPPNDKTILARTRFLFGNTEKAPLDTVTKLCSSSTWMHVFTEKPNTSAEITMDC